MRRSVKIVVIFAALVMMACPVFADFEEIKMFAEDKTTEKYIFDFDETPWLYIKLTEESDNFIKTLWRAPSLEVHPEDTLPDETDEWWISLTDWETEKEVGLWRISALLYLVGTPDASDVDYSTSFTVTPEPMGCALFALGGVTIALFRLRRKRT